jgi:hypothetical protein
VPLKTEENMAEIESSNEGTSEAVWALIFDDFEYAKK